MIPPNQTKPNQTKPNQTKTTTTTEQTNTFSHVPHGETSHVFVVRSVSLSVPNCRCVPLRLDRSLTPVRRSFPQHCVKHHIHNPPCHVISLFSPSPFNSKPKHSSFCLLLVANPKHTPKPNKTKHASSASCSNPTVHQALLFLFVSRCSFVHS